MGPPGSGKSRAFEAADLAIESKPGTTGGTDYEHYAKVSCDSRGSKRAGISLLDPVGHPLPADVTDIGHAMSIVREYHRGHALRGFLANLPEAADMEEVTKTLNESPETGIRAKIWIVAMALTTMNDVMKMADPVYERSLFHQGHRDRNTLSIMEGLGVPYLAILTHVDKFLLHEALSWGAEEEVKQLTSTTAIYQPSAHPLLEQVYDRLRTHIGCDPMLINPTKNKLILVDLVQQVIIAYSRWWCKQRSKTQSDLVLMASQKALPTIIEWEKVLETVTASIVMGNDGNPGSRETVVKMMDGNINRLINGQSITTFLGANTGKWDLPPGSSWLDFAEEYLKLARTQYFHGVDTDDIVSTLSGRIEAKRKSMKEDADALEKKKQDMAAGVVLSLHARRQIRDDASEYSVSGSVHMGSIDGGGKRKAQDVEIVGTPSSSKSRKQDHGSGAPSASSASNAASSASSSAASKPRSPSPSVEDDDSVGVYHAYQSSMPCLCP